MILKFLDKDNLHHAYLVEGSRDALVSEILAFSKGSEICHITLDTFKIEDARNLKSLGAEKANQEGKKVFVIATSSILREAQNAMLKIFEEPIPDTHFFIVVPDASALLPTFVSRFFLIREEREDLGSKMAQEFIKMPANKRLDFIKELLVDDDEENLATDSPRTKALRFLDSLESELHTRLVSKAAFDTGVFEHIFKVRQFLRQPGSATKTLLESTALIIPN